MIIDYENTFSAQATGDSPTAIGDNASANVIDQGVSGLSFSPPGGGAYVAPFLIAKAQAAFTSGGSGTLQIVLQDSPDNSTWTDRALGTIFTVGGSPAPSINAVLAAFRIPSSLARYVRVVYRIGTAVMTAGTALAFLTLDADIIDIAMREAGTYVSQSNQLSEAVGNSIAGS